MTEQEIDDTYLDQIKVPKQAYKVTYSGHATIANRHGASESLYGREGFAWRNPAWMDRQGFDESPDEHGSRERWFFWVSDRERKDKNIFIVYVGNLQF